LIFFCLSSQPILFSGLAALETADHDGLEGANTLTAELQRLMAFAFASADLLIEVNAGLDITFALGATTGMVAPSDADLVGRRFLSLLAESDRLYAATLLDDLKPAARCGPILVRLAVDREDGVPREALLHACRLPTSPKTINLTLAQPSLAGTMASGGQRRGAEDQLLDEASFKDAARRMAETAHQLRKHLEMTFVDLPALAGPGVAMPETEVREVVQRIGTLLRAASADGATAGRLGPGRFGVVHDASRSAEEIRARVAEAVVRPDGQRPDVKSATVEIARDDLPPGMAAHAIQFVVDQVAGQGVEADRRANIRNVFGSMVDTTLRKVKAFSDTVGADDFTLVYQPVACLSTGRLHHFEALTRFKFEESPLATIHFAEEVGIIGQMDLAVLTRMIQTMGRPGSDRRTSFAVNVSSQSLANPVFVNCLSHLLSSNRALAGRLAIEVTESARIKDPGETNRILQGIRGQGFAVTLDDMGTGVDSLKLLQRLRVDHVKIDVPPTRGTSGARGHDAKVAALVRLCDDLGAVTIAERIETREQASALEDIGVRYGQGYHFGRPTRQPELPWQFGDKPMRFDGA
jgi:EAL domain-containing protein (putative c-di-GMP-specific phosphodiesterase class I)